MHRATAFILCLSAVVAVSACGSDDEPTTVIQQQTVTVPPSDPTVTETVPAPTTTTATPTTPSSSKKDCGVVVEGLRLELVAGDVECVEATAIANEFDQSGEKVQQLGAWTCESGEKDVYPLIFSCRSGDLEFAVYLPGE